MRAGLLNVPDRFSPRLFAGSVLREVLERRPIFWKLGGVAEGAHLWTHVREDIPAESEASV